ncbi:site-specific integrase [Planktomarina temperata]|nr:site-specific integrase [Planktomarina temperata]
MGSIRKRGLKFQAQVRREGAQPVSKTFTLKKDAEVWMRSVEARIDIGEVNVTTPKTLTLRDLLTRYAIEITPEKKGRDQEQRRISRLLRDQISDYRLSQLSSAVMAEFRDRRIKDGVRAAQIDLILIRHCIKLARLEWGVNMPANPVEQIRIQNGVKRRDRRLQEGEYELLQATAEQCRNPYIWACIDFAVETGMRRSEILSLLWENVDIDSRIAVLPDTKNGSKREVPLTKKAAQILDRLPRDEARAFSTTDYTIRHGWDRLVKRAGIEGLRFHDLRHEAVSRFFEMGLSVPEVAAISGHKDYRMLASYTHVSAKSLAKKL